MKYLFLLLISFNVYSSELCKDASDLARTMLQARYNGLSMSSMMEKMAGNEFAEQLVILTYERPSYTTEKYKDNDLDKFENQVYLNCFKATQPRDKSKK